jgi:hypothetical protein
MDKAPAVMDKAPAVMDKAPAVMDKAPAVGGNPADLWPQVLTSLKPLVRALYSACSVSSPTADTVVLSAPNAVHQMKCNEHAATVAAAFEKLTGRKVGVNVDVGDAPKDRSAPRKTKANAVSDEIPHDDIDPDELSDMPIVPIESALDRISRSFPGSKVIDESDTK